MSATALIGLRKVRLGTRLAVGFCVVVGCGPALEPSYPDNSRASEQGQQPAARGATARSPEPAKGPAQSDEPVELVSRYEGAPALAEFSGQASYYSDALAGHSTASGEPYDPKARTAAHRSLPFRSVVRVVNQGNQRMVYVRINDRGPFVRGRVLDLSRAAASDIGLLRQGVAKVRVEVVEYGPSPKRSRK